MELVRLLAIVLLIGCTAATTLVLEAEGGNYQGTGSQRHRSAASNDATVLLHQGGCITLSFRVFSSCTFLVQNIAYTNDGSSDTISITLDGTIVGTFQTVAAGNFGHNWNVVRNSGSVGVSSSIVSGNHTIKVVATSTDQYGVEIDTVVLNFNEQCIAENVIDCTSLPTAIPASGICSNVHGFVQQKSQLTNCAEEDNIHIPIYLDDIQKFTITATLPEYASLTSANNRNADFTNCELTSRTIWRVGNEDMSSGEFSSSCSTPPITLNVETQTGDICGQLNNQDIREMFLAFKARGPSEGLVEATIGSVVMVQFVSVSGMLVVEAAAYGRAATWVSLGTRSFTSSSLSHTWQVPDLTWEEGMNNISFSVMANSSANAAAFLDYIKLEMREEMGEYEIGEIYSDGITIIKAIGKDFWWLHPQAMTVANTNTGQQWSNVIYVRISRKVPGINSWPEVFVLYQDGNSRVLTFPPSSIDWIPFGSSVIIGQSDPDVVRPYSAISQIDFNPTTLKMTLHYSNGGQAVLQIQTTTTSTTVTVTSITYTMNSTLPFATLRSMWVRDGNADVDHVNSEDGVRHILQDMWSNLTGTTFYFFRTCVSQHNTLSPDIRIEAKECTSEATSPPSSIFLPSSSPTSTFPRTSSPPYSLPPTSPPSSIFPPSSSPTSTFPRTSSPPYSLPPTSPLPSTFLSSSPPTSTFPPTSPPSISTTATAVKLAYTMSLLIITWSLAMFLSC